MDPTIAWVIVTESIASNQINVPADGRIQVSGKRQPNHLICRDRARSVIVDGHKRRVRRTSLTLRLRSVSTWLTYSRQEYSRERIVAKGAAIVMYVARMFAFLCILSRRLHVSDKTSKGTNERR